MQLLEVFIAREAWGRLAGLKTPPQTAYRLLKYLRKVSAELEIIEKQRTAVIREVSGTKDGESVTFAPGTPEFTAFVDRFNAVLKTESDLKPLDTKLEDLIANLDAEKGNVLSVQDLGALEPFFAATD